MITIYYGFQPSPILHACSGAVEDLMKNYDAALAMHAAALSLH